VPVIQGGKRLLIATRHRAQQRRVIALHSLRRHARSRSHTPTHFLSQQQTSSVPIIHNQIS